MSDSYIIEVSSKAAGIIVRDEAGYRFFAANRDFNSLEGRYFKSARDAERAAKLSKTDRETKSSQATTRDRRFERSGHVTREQHAPGQNQLVKIVEPQF